jgi:hypothetical protein
MPEAPLGNEQQKNSENHCSESTKRSLLSSGLPTNLKPTDNQGAESNNKKENFFDNLWNHIKKPEIFLQLMTLIVIIWYTYYAGQQAGFAEKSSNAAMDAAKTAKDAVTLTIAQGQKALDASIEASKLDQRAWVGTTETTPPPLMEGDKRVYVKAGSKMTFDASVVNSGKTPALKVTTNFGIRTYSSNESIPTYQPDTTKGGASAVQPGAHFRLVLSTRVLTQKEIGILKSGIENLYFLGLITYEDIFGRSHQTTFCYCLLPDLSTIIFCPTGNTMD